MKIDTENMYVYYMHSSEKLPYFDYFLAIGKLSILCSIKR